LSSFLHQRHKKWPFAINATMTHDAKRAEDARTRISVLSEVPQEWETCLNNWSLWNEPKCRVVKGIRAPERNEEILLYQTLLGSWPVTGPICACYRQRIQDFMVKAVREAMVHTRWTVPNLDHEKALIDFVFAILEDSPDNRFLQNFKPFAAKLAFHGALNSLSQLVLKLTSPGVADFYQGTELWDLRLVDPDNRGPVDFEHRRQLLAQVDNNGCSSRLMAGWQDGQVKMYVMRRGLHFRRDNAALFLKGDYVSVEAEGLHRDCVVAMARRFRSDWCIAVVPRFTTRLAPAEDQLWGHWGDTRIVLPKEAPPRWTSVLNSENHHEMKTIDRTLLVSDLLDGFPVAMFSSI
jgi:(1->4)-alpha-D-glucan 1-alpha-D-glucosylmutase